MAFFWCYYIAFHIPTLCFQGNLAVTPTEEPTVGGTPPCTQQPWPRSLPFHVGFACLLVQSKAASLSTSKVEGSRSALSSPAASGAGEACGAAVGQLGADVAQSGFWFAEQRFLIALL